MMVRILILILGLLFFAGPVSAKTNVIATLPWIGSLAGDIGKEKVKVVTLVKSNQDPHYVEAKPSMILEVRKADLLLYNGLDLEVGYLPVLIESSRNPRVQPGSPGHLDCSRFVDPIDRPTRADRSMGDVHPLGNPHYHLSPRNIYRVAEGITQGLSRVDPVHEGLYRANLHSFQERFREKQKGWSEHGLEGKKFVSYHQFFEYFALEFDFQIIGYVEPKPGIPPSAGHVEKLIEILKREKPHAILATPYNGEKEVRFLSQKTGVKYLVVPHDVGVNAEAKDWFALIDQVLASLK
jgi:zinc/manganese transport system substrate-binding protein